MMVTYTARPTTYRGTPMRSRPEARHAAFLDDHGEHWIYEPRAFGGRRGQYLPDFELDPVPGSGPWYVEVRPTLERAYVALSQMLIIRESVPAADLEIVIPDVGTWLNLSWRGRWQWYPWS